MGKVDILSREYLKRKDVFSDIVNLGHYEGKPIVTPQMLREHSEIENQVIVSEKQKGEKLSKEAYVQKYRDVMKQVCRDGKQTQAYAIIGIEEQTKVHYAIPVRLMLYDALNYSNQVSGIAAEHREKKDWKSDDEFLSGYTSEDKLIPVQTFVVYLSSTAWEGPRCLHDMLDMEGMMDEEKAKFPNYPIQIIEPTGVSDEQLELLQSNLKYVFGFIKYSKDEKDLEAYVNSHIGFENIDALTAQLINEVCALNFEYNKNDDKEDIDMCKAIDDMRKHSREEGREEGKTSAMLKIYHNMINKGMSEVEARALSGVTDEMLENEKQVSA